MSQFFVKLVPLRATFAHDITETERELMQEHAAYWRECMRRGEVVVFGPVMDPAGVYGMGILDVATAEAAQALVTADPAARLMEVELYPMRAVTSA